MLDKTTVIDQITVTENGIVLYRQAIRIVENGDVLAKSYHRYSIVPGQDLTGLPDQVVAICNAAWTPDVIAAYQASIEES